MNTKSTFDLHMEDPEFQKEFDKEYKELEREDSKRPRLVSFLGVIGSGKSYSASKLVKQGYVQVAFADELREMAWDILGWRPDTDDFDRQYDWFKKLSLNDIYYIDAKDDEFLTKKLNEAKGNSFCISGRQFLQNLGTEGIRKRDPDFWARITKQKIQKLLDEGKRVVTTDCRFYEEYKYLKELGGEFVFCDYHSNRYNSDDIHESEQLAQFLLKVVGLKGTDKVLHEHFERYREQVLKKK